MMQAQQAAMPAVGTDLEQICNQCWIGRILLPLVPGHAPTRQCCLWPYKHPNNYKQG